MGYYAAMLPKLVSAMLALTLLVACASRAQAPEPAKSGAPKPTATEVPVHVQGAGNASTPTVLTQTKGNRRIYTVRALAFEGDAIGANGVAHLEQPHITFRDKSGSVTIADAPKATVKQRDKSIDMTGGVHARTADGGILTCDSLRYDYTTERLLGMGHVVLVSRDGLRLTGDRLDGDVRLRDARVTSGGAG